MLVGIPLVDYSMMKQVCWWVDDSMSRFARYSKKTKNSTALVRSIRPRVAGAVLFSLYFIMPWFFSQSDQSCPVVRLHLWKMICYPKNGVSVEPKYSVLLTTRVSRTLNFRAHIPVLSSTAIARGQSRNMEGLARSANSRTRVRELELRSRQFASQALSQTSSG